MSTSTPLTRLTLALLGAGSLFLAVAVDAGTPRPIGGAIQLLRPEGAVTPGEGLFSDEAPAVAANPGSGFVVGWIQLEGQGTRVLSRFVSADAAVGEGIELRRLWDERNEARSLLWARWGLSLTALWRTQYFRGPIDLESRTLVDDQGTPVLGGDWLGRPLSIGTCFQAFSSSDQSRLSWSWVFLGPNGPVVYHEAALLTDRELVQLPTLGVIRLPREWTETWHLDQMPCPAFSRVASAWWTFERGSRPTLRFRNFPLGREFALSGLRGPVFVHGVDPALGYDHLVAVAARRRGPALRIYYASWVDDALSFVAESTAGDRVLAADARGRLVVARPQGSGLEVRFLGANFEAEGAPFEIPSTLVAAAFDDSGRQVLLSWTAERSVTRPNGGHIVPISARLFEWVP